MSKSYKKLVKSIVKELGKYALLSEAGLSSVAGGELEPHRNAAVSPGGYHVDYIPNSSIGDMYERGDRIGLSRNPLRLRNLPAYREPRWCYDPPAHRDSTGFYDSEWEEW